MDEEDTLAVEPDACVGVGVSVGVGIGLTRDCMAWCTLASMANVARGMTVRGAPG